MSDWPGQTMQKAGPLDRNSYSQPWSLSLRPFPLTKQDLGLWLLAAWSGGTRPSRSIEPPSAGNRQLRELLHLGTFGGFSTKYDIITFVLLPIYLTQVVCHSTKKQNTRFPSKETDRTTWPRWAPLISGGRAGLWIIHPSKWVISSMLHACWVFTCFYLILCGQFLLIENRSRFPEISKTDPRPMRDPRAA